SFAVPVITSSTCHNEAGFHHASKLIMYEIFPDGILTREGFTPTTNAVMLGLLLNFFSTVLISFVDNPGAYDKNLISFFFNNSSIFLVPAFSYCEKIITC